MKKYIITVLLCNIFAFAQEGVIAPINTSGFDAISGTYIKDVDNVFNPYVGTWVGTWNSKELRLKIVKDIRRLHTFIKGDYYYADGLVVFYRITDLTTSDFIEDNLDELDNTIAKIFSINTPFNNKFIEVF